ncbi:MAG: hypothetical protein JST76_12230 [Bacteroidetes bacterium]|nr:hypothetical protein [Bacteroidota bacterium]
MEYKRTTPVPNAFFDHWLPRLTESELKVLLVVVRQTYGWIDRQTGGRKMRDRISGWQLRQKAGLSRRIVTKAVQSLSDKRLLEASDYKGNPLPFASDRKGKKYLYYRVLVPDFSAKDSCAPSAPEPAHKGAHDKTNSTKEIRTRQQRTFSGHVAELIVRKAAFSANTDQDRPPC